MPSRGEAFSGCVVALVTPFHDGAVDFEELKRSIDFQIAQGVPVLSPAGTTGECPTLTRDEHERVIATVVETLRRILLRFSLPVSEGAGSSTLP
jgi:4-hydroxy-tetrahydrodipicolinate synthase